MKDLFGKLVDMSYEFVGVIIPGFILCLFLTIWWLLLGCSCGAHLLGTLNLGSLDALLKSWSSTTIFVLSVFALLVFYIVGQILVEYSRKGIERRKTDDGFRAFWRRWLSLRALNPTVSYASYLQPLLEASWVKLRPNEQDPLDWKQFYRVARSLVDERLKHSLVTSYQNKYTLHRSIASAAAIVFWLSIISLDCWIMGGYEVWTPHAFGLFLLAVFAVGVRHSFVSSFEFHWTNFGSALVAETYALLFGPKEPAPKDDKPEGK